MAWFKIDDNFYDHPKVDELSLDAVGLWALCGTYAARHLTDGFIAARRVTRLGGTDELAAELVDAELWEPTEGGYEFRNWHEYQPTKDGVEAKRDADRERKRKQRRNKNGEFTLSQKSHGVTPSGITPESQAASRGGSQTPSHGASHNGHAEAENQGGLTSEGVNPLDVSADDETGDLLSLDFDQPHDDAVDAQGSQECHTVTPGGIAEASRRESYRPVPSRPDPSRTTTSFDAGGSTDDDEKPAKPEPVFSDEVHELAEHLAGWVVSNGNRKPNVTKRWLQAIDRLMRLDDYTPEQIRQVIDWSQKSEFWFSNILSAPKLREKFDTLKNQMFRDQNRNSTTGPAGMAPGTERALNTLQIGQALQAAHDNGGNELT